MEKMGKMDKILVLVRVRPLYREEATMRSPWKLSTKSVASSKTCRPLVPYHSFTFDRVYGTRASSSDIYQSQIKDIITSAISGVNGAVIAYGHSGTGKTYTMRGSPQESGIMVLAVRDVFQRVQETCDREFLVRVSYLEVAHEEVYDLLASRNHKLDIHEDTELGVVLGAREEIVNSPDQVISLIEFADARHFVGPKNPSNCQGSHKIFRMVIESRLDKKEDFQNKKARAGVQVSVLNLVEVSPFNTRIRGKESDFQEGVQPDKGFVTLQTVMSKLSEDGEEQRDTMPYCESKLTYILQPSLGGNARTCVICNISPAMVHLEETISTLEFARKANRVKNCYQVNEIWTEKALFNRQRKEIEELRNKFKEVESPNLQDDILNRRNALLMIELEREKMSFEYSSNSQSEIKEQEQEQNGENFISEETGLDKCIEMGEFGGSSQVKVFELCSGNTAALLEQDNNLQNNSSGLGLGSIVGSKRKRRPATTMVADKLEQADFVNESKIAGEVNWVKLERLVERQRLSGLHALIGQKKTEQHELLAQKDDECRKLQRKIAELEAEKAIMERKLHEEELNYRKALEAIRDEIMMKKTKRMRAEVAAVRNVDVQEAVVDEEKSRKVAVRNQLESNGTGNTQVELQGGGHVFEENALKQNIEAQTSTSQQIEEHLKLSKAKETQIMRKKPLMVNKGCQKFQNFQSPSELSTVHRELALAKETISMLEDERDGLWKELNHMKTRQETQNQLDKSKIEDNTSADGKFHQLLAPTVETLKTEVESTASTIDALLALMSESFQILVADVKSFQEGVTEMKVLNGVTNDICESLENAKLQLMTLRHGKLASEQEVHSMKSELAKLECVVERQSGVLKVLSDNENLLSELASVRTAMNEAAGASELQMSAIHEEYEVRLKELECEYKHWRQECMQLEEVQTNMQAKLDTAEADVMRLTQVLEDKSNPGKRPKNLKSRLVMAEAEVLRLTNALGKQAALEQERQTLQVQLVRSESEVEILKMEVEKKKQLEKENSQVLTELADSKALIMSLTETCEEKLRKEGEQKNTELKIEAEVVNLKKRLDEKSDVEEQQRKTQLELITLEGRMGSMAQELEQKKIREESYHDVVARLNSSETAVARLTETLSRERQQKNIVDLDNRKIQDEFQISEAEIRRLTEILDKELGKREKLENEHKESIGEVLNSESQVASCLKKVVEENDLLRKTHQEVLDKLATSEAEVARLNETLTRKLQEKLAVETEHIEMLSVHAGLKNEIAELTEILNREIDSRKNLEKEHVMIVEVSTNLKAEVARLIECLASELECRKNFEKDNREIIERSAGLQDEVERLNDTLTSELQKRTNLEKEYFEFLDQLATSGTDVARLRESLTRGGKERNDLVTDYCEILPKLSNSKTQIAGFTEDKLRLEEELKNIQLALEGSEAEVFRLTDELTYSLTDKSKLECEYSRIQLELSAAQEEITKMNMQKVIMEKKQGDLFIDFTNAETGRQRLSDELTEKAKLVEELQSVYLELANSKAELMNLRNALGEKLGVEEARIKTQLELVRKQGELEKLTKELRVNRKMVKEQKKLLHRLSSTQAEVKKLSTTLGGPSDHQMTNTKPENTASDATVIGLGCNEKESNDEKFQIQQNLPRTEAEFNRLLKSVESYEQLEREHTRIQLQLARSEAEIRKLTLALKEKCMLEEQWKTVRTKLLEAGMLTSRTEKRDSELNLEDLCTELLDKERKIKDLQDNGVCLRDTGDHSTADCETLARNLEQLHKERDDWRVRCTTAENKLQSLQVSFEKQKKELETVDRNWKAKCQKTDKEMVDLRAKLEKMEEATGWLVRDKTLLEERLTCSEAQLKGLGEAARATSTELEMSHHKIHLLTAQHQSEVSAFCGELALKSAQNSELEKELQKLLTHHHQVPLLHGGYNNHMSSAPFRPQQWPHPTVPGHQPIWGSGPSTGQR